MKKILDKVNLPKDLKKLSLKEQELLAQELRDYIIHNVSNTGGHLASNLGVVELTIAIHKVFNAPKDKIVFDVGHQCYVHKILTGRKKEIPSLRKFNGLSGFTRTSESIYDTFNTGHSSNSISIASGIARSRDILKKDYEVITVIGDGSLTGGMALEALNDVGSSNLNMKVILNDNEMSISKNVGGIPLLLSKLRTRKFYTKSNKKIKNMTIEIPIIGKYVIRLVHFVKKTIKQIFIKNMYFEDIGFTYLGPVDGHNLEQLENILERSKYITGPVLIHVITKKGKGYRPAEDYPDKFHGIGKFDLDTGNLLSKGSKDYSNVFGHKLVELASKNSKIVAVTAAMKDGTGLTEFALKYPDRFFDVGIAEEHALGLVAGMATSGLKPFIAIYSSFLQRGYDQLIHDIALQDLPVVIAVDRAGIVGSDGETHQGIFDLSFLRTIPNMTIMAPKNFKELENMLEFTLNYNHPVAIRYPRGGEAFALKKLPSSKVVLGKSEIIFKGPDILILAIGKMVNTAIEIRDLLLKDNISSEIINVRFLKPLDKDTILKETIDKKIVITIEDNLLNGGLYDAILETITNNVPIIGFGYNDKFVPQGSIEELEQDNGLDAKNIVNTILEKINHN